MPSPSLGSSHSDAKSLASGTTISGLTLLSAIDAPLACVDSGVDFRVAVSGSEPLTTGACVSGAGLILPVMGDVAADEHAAERHRGAQNNETTGGLIDDQVAGLRDDADQATESAE